MQNNEQQQIIQHHNHVVLNVNDTEQQQKTMDEICAILESGCKPQQYSYIDDTKHIIKGAIAGGTIGLLSGFGVKFGADPIITKTTKSIYIAQTYKPNTEKLTNEINNRTNKIEKYENRIQEAEHNRNNIKKQFDKINELCLNKLENFNKNNKEINEKILQNISKLDKYEIERYCNKKPLGPYFKIQPHKNYAILPKENITDCPQITLTYDCDQSCSLHLAPNPNRRRPNSGSPNRRRPNIDRPYIDRPYITVANDCGPNKFNAYNLETKQQFYPGNHKELNEQIEDYFNTYNNFKNSPITKEYHQINENIKTLKQNVKQLNKEKDYLLNRIKQEKNKLNQYKTNTGMTIPTASAITGALVGGYNAHKTYKNKYKTQLRQSPIVDGTTSSATYVYPLDHQDVTGISFNSLINNNRNFIWIDETANVIYIAGNNQNVKRLKKALNLPHNNKREIIYKDNPNFAILCSALLHYTPQNHETTREFLLKNHNPNVDFSLKNTYNKIGETKCNIF